MECGWVREAQGLFGSRADEAAVVGVHAATLGRGRGQVQVVAAGRTDGSVDVGPVPCLGPGPVRRFTGPHTGRVGAVGWVGERLVTCGADGSLAVWRAMVRGAGD